MSLHFDPMASATYGNVANFMVTTPLAVIVNTQTLGVSYVAHDVIVELVEL